MKTTWPVYILPSNITSNYLEELQITVTPGAFIGTYFCISVQGKEKNLDSNSNKVFPTLISIFEKSYSSWYQSYINMILVSIHKLYKNLYKHAQQS